jgi:ligand-binding sensor domain-containing protein
MNDDYKLDLPVERWDDRDLPVLAPGKAAYHERAIKIHKSWSNLVSQQHVRSLALAPLSGEIWLATGGGILRWQQGLDRFTRYTSEHGLPGNSVAAVAVDGNGQVWTLAPAGLYVVPAGSTDRLTIPQRLFYFDGDAWRSYAMLETSMASCLSVDSTGRLWIGTVDGIYAIGSPYNAPLIEYPLPPGYLPRAMTIVGKNDAWLCNARGVYQLEGTDWTHRSPRLDILALARQGQNLWLGAIGGLARIDLAENEPHQTRAWPAGEVTALAPATDGVWAACKGQVGLATDSDWTPLNNCDLVQGARITCLAPAGNDKMWIGTHAGLLHGRSDKVRFHLTDAPPDVIGPVLPERPPETFSTMIQALAVQQVKNHAILWIGTPRGLFRLNLFTEGWKGYPQRSLRDIRALVSGDTQEDMWAASWSGGLHRLAKQTVQEFCPGPILAMAQGLDSTLWAAGLDGLYRGDGSTWTLVVPANRPPLSAKGWMRAVAQTRTGRLWIGTSTGMLVFNSETDTLDKADGVLGNADIRSLLIVPDDESEYIWVGTARGLYGGCPGNLKSILGLGSLAVTSLAWDGSAGMLWTGTENGLFRLVNEGSGWQVVDKFTTHNSGLAANRITVLALNTSETGEVSLWVGTPCGLSCYTC